MKVIKRDGSLVEFDKNKIENAIIKAMKRGSGIYKPLIAKLISEDAEEYFKIEGNSTIYKIEEFVYNRLIHYGESHTAKAYEGYRSVQSFKRQVNTTDNDILGLISKTNEDVLRENSNKNSIVASTQRDLIAGEVSKDIARRKLIPAHIVQAHDEGIIHWHDMDYTLQSIHNCFSGDTKFITDFGVLKFNQCSPGQKVKTLDKNGIWRESTVNKYGKQRLQTVTISSGRTVKKIRCTENHRWILKDNTVTTNLKIGDRLHLLHNIDAEFEFNPYAFCLGFVLGDGTDTKNTSSEGVRVRLCGDKVKHMETFLECGYRLSSYKPDNSDDIILTKSGSFKNKFIESKAWKFMSHDDLRSLFEGYYAADDSKDRNTISTSSKNLAEMIRDISAVAGYHVTSETFTIRDTEYKKNAHLYTFRFMKSQPANRNWIVKDINRDDKHLYDVWCVEEPITNTFTLDGGVVTGNCMLINLEDMLNNGTVINEKLVERPKSFSTACTVATQIMAQIASGQYGGQSITIKHLAPFLRISYDKYYNHYFNNKGFTNLVSKDLAEDRMMEELKSGVQTIRYQLSTLQTSNGQSPFATIYLEIEEGHEYEREMALICEEMIKQRLEGMKNYKSQEIGEAFPKLVYLLDEHNCLEGGKYDYITKLAAKCNTKRLVPDYQSAKIMRKNYDGETFPPINILVA